MQVVVEGGRYLMAQDRRAILQQAQQNRAEFGKTLARIRSDDSLSEKGKQAQITLAWQQHAQAQKALRAAYTQAREARVTELQRALFAPAIWPSASAGEKAMVMLSHRDAVSRAQALKSAQDAAALMRQALRDGDEHLARATAAVAFGNQWDEATDAYITAYPDTRPAFQELADLGAGLTQRAKLELAQLFGADRPKEVPASASDTPPVQTGSAGAGMGAGGDAA